MIGAALRAYLLSLDDLVALVGEQVHPMFLPQRGNWPAVIYGRTGGEHEVCADVCPAQGTVEFEIHCRSLDPEQADAMALTIYGSKDAPRLDGFKGEMAGGGRTYRMTSPARIRNPRDEVFAPVHNEPTWLASVVLPVTIQYREV